MDRQGIVKRLRSAHPSKAVKELPLPSGCGGQSLCRTPLSFQTTGDIEAVIEESGPKRAVPNLQTMRKSTCCGEPA